MCWHPSDMMMASEVFKYSVANGYSAILPFFILLTNVAFCWEIWRADTIIDILNDEMAFNDILTEMKMTEKASK